MSDNLPGGVEAFLERTGWGGSMVQPLEGDASFRRYFRILHGDRSAMLMDAPPPTEDPAPFLRAAKWLDANGMRAPQVYAEDAERGLVLIEDFGEVRMREYVDQWPIDERAVYAGAIDALIQLHKLPPGPFLDYSMSEYMREAKLLIEWYCPAQGLTVDGPGYVAAWQKVFGGLLPRQRAGVTVLRDYHAENIMLLGGVRNQGLLDFQDALVGHRAYDLVSLLQDARRDVDPALETEMFDYYVAETRAGADFLADYAALGAQRNAKIVGIFTRLWKRDGKPRYLSYIPRVWALLERDLTHPALAPVAQWFEANVPVRLREAGGGEWPE